MTAGWDGTVRFWDPQTGKEQEEVGGVLLFDPKTWKQASKLDKTFGLTALAWSPQGSFILTGNLRGKISLRDATTGEMIKTFGQHRGSITSLDYAPSGTAFVSGSLDKRLARWNAILTEEEQVSRRP